MKIIVLDHRFTICKVHSLANVNFDADYCFVGKTDEELSLICTTEYVPDSTVERVDGWRGFRIQGTLDFSVIGVLASISSLLSEAKIPIMAVSSFNTDYIFTKEKDFDTAVSLLTSHGYSI